MLDKKGTTLEHIILLRGVTPNGKNAIPKMSYLVDILTEAGFQQVRTYIQSGNIILESDLDLETIRERVHTLINENIGADLKMVIKNKSDFKKIVQEAGGIVTDMSGDEGWLESGDIVAANPKVLAQMLKIISEHQ